MVLTLLRLDDLGSVNHTTSNTLLASANLLVIGIHAIGFEVHDNVSDRLYGVVELKETVEVAGVADVLKADRFIRSRTCCSYIRIRIVQLH